ncbi:gephyrin-like molybdotransferase Glp [Carboxydochorda subterranea]|uniref:Molybdopterin molybdenumtransferase n=1 Tax=Carboxydichorda subterranea TaxID=3109565 RepID=A0ABZ1BZ19_9FIRM|nr:gephyrin-like molybdotransferase Glp [Limnochorda sp. L945t]WRP17978.1 gephyrin-like molybdotransferase Glp [Limnochorda sp. L945t]
MGHQLTGLPHAPVRVEEAESLVLSLARPAGAERVPVAGALGRRLAAPVVAPFDVWPFMRAAMDGYALRARDLAGASPAAPAQLRVVGEAFAGSGRAGLAVGPGEAVRVMTGAVMPEGADAVAPLETVEEAGASAGRGSGAMIRVARELEPGANVFPKGEDAAAGEVVLRAGHRIGPSSLGLLAALGIAEVEVVRRPRVAVLAVGDELLERGAGAPPPGRVYDANTPALVAALEELGALSRPLGVVRDDPDALEEAIRTGLSFDMLVITGGASVGDRDFTVATLARAGAQVRFTRLLLKPGKAATFAHTDRCLAFALPGNPGAAMTAFWLLVAPAVRAMAGAPPEEIMPGRVPARLMQPVRVRPGRPHYLWGRMASCRGVRAVWPAGPSGTAVIRSQALANALIALPAEVAQAPAGSVVEVLPLPGEVPAFDWLPVPTLSVVGPHDSGKTTLIEALLPELARRGIRAGALKHDVHGFVMDYEGKDTWRLGRAGAERVGIAGPGRSAVLWHREAYAFDAMVALLGEGLQLVLTEGYKSARMPKIEVVPEGGSLLSPAAELLAVVSRQQPPPQPEWLTFADLGAVAERVERWLERWYREKAEAVLGHDREAARP